MTKAVLAGLGVLGFFALAAPAAADDVPDSRRIPIRQRIEITPGRLMYRECVDGYRLVPRPYWGETVVMPYLHCHWVRG